MITFSRTTLREALAGLRVLKLPRQILPVHQHVLVAGGENSVEFTGTDLDQFLCYRGEASGTGCLQMLVPYELLQTVGKATDADGAIELFADDRFLLRYTVKGVPLEEVIPALDPAEFPSPPAAAGAGALTLPAGVIGAMQEALGCASQDSSRYVLNGVYLDAHAVVATDGRQLYRRNSLDLPITEGLIFPYGPVPGILPNEAAWLSRWHSENRPYAQLRAGRWTWTTKLIDGNYPNYRQAIPRLDEAGGLLRIGERDAARILSVAPKLPGYKDKESKIILRLAADGAVLRTAQEYPKVYLALDQSEVVRPAKNEACFNVRYLLAALQRGLRNLHVRDHLTPLAMTDEQRLHLWMPVQTNETLRPIATPEAVAAILPPADPSGESPAPVVSPEPGSPASDPAPEPVTLVRSTHQETHQPNISTATMVAPDSTSPQPASETREGIAPGAIASRVPAAPAPPVSVVDAINARLGRLRDLLREAGTEFANIQTLVKEQQRSYRTLERDHEALKKNIRALREVPV